MKLLLLALALAPSQAASCIENRGGIQSATKPVYDCVEQTARRLERSKEPAREVAIAAVSTCRPSIAAFRGMLTVCGKTIEAVAMLTGRLEEEAQNRAIAVVVNMRARR